MAYANQTLNPGVRLPQAGFLSGLKARIARYSTYRRTINELSALSTAELADLGMNRSQIRAIAWSVAYEAQNEA